MYSSKRIRLATVLALIAACLITQPLTFASATPSPKKLVLTGTVTAISQVNTKRPSRPRHAMDEEQMTMWTDILDHASRLRAEGEPFVIATVVAYKSPQSAKPGSKAIIRPDGSISGWIGGGCVQPIVVREAQKALNTGKPKLVGISPEATHGDWKGVEAYLMTCHGGGSLEIYLEPVLPKPNLLIVGNSPVAQILAGLGRLLDFKVS